MMLFLLLQTQELLPLLVFKLYLLESLLQLGMMRLLRAIIGGRLLLLLLSRDICILSIIIRKGCRFCRMRSTSAVTNHVGASAIADTVSTAATGAAGIIVGIAVIVVAIIAGCRSVI